MMEFLEDFYRLNCTRCGVRFGIPTELERGLRSSKNTFYCPNGHTLSWIESEADKLRRERDLLAQRIAQRDDEIARQRNLRETAERQAAAARGQVTKIKKRIGHGVCPCCNRTFGDLARHMMTKHPTFSAEAAE